MKDFLIEKLDYNGHINQRLFESFQSQGKDIPAQVMTWMSHILNAQEIWNSRIEGRQSAYDVWQAHTMDQFSPINAHLIEDSKRLLNEFPVGTMISYRTTEGTFYEKAVEKIIYHIVNHGTYHRGQIAHVMRQEGLRPLSTDYIFYHRN